MNIAVLSGKGGAGKTLVAVNLAAAAGQCTYIDCDVEEPNGRLFLKPEQVRTEPVCNLYPVFDAAKCIGCKKCVQFCRFHGLVYIKEKPMVFSEVCHSCGGCQLVCPTGAITEAPKPIGAVELGTYGKVNVVTGVLNPGEVSGVPVIRAALRHAAGLTVIDCPPGSACSVTESVDEADYCILVAEPTAFGFHNFRMVHELVTLLGKPCGVVVNKQDASYAPLEDYCARHELPVLLRIPYNRDFGEAAAGGQLITEQFPEAREMFAALLNEIGGAV